MPARRRRTLIRSPVQRAEMWDKKMKGETYATLLPKLKENAMPKVVAYQAIHETLIDNVRRVLGDFGVESSLMQEYMWYAQGLWRLTQVYKDKALQKEADALYLQYLAKGRNDLALRAVAQTLGIKISTIEDIVERTLTPALISIVNKGTIIADGSEQVILEYVGKISTISGYIDLSNMQSGDTVIVRSYVKIKEGGDYVLYHPETFIGQQTEPALYTLPRVSGLAFKVTLQQTTGSYKSFDYLFVKGA